MFNFNTKLAYHTHPSVLKYVGEEKPLVPLEELLWYNEKQLNELKKNEVKKHLKTYEIKVEEIKVKEREIEEIHYAIEKIIDSVEFKNRENMIISELKKKMTNEYDEDLAYEIEELLKFEDCRNWSYISELEDLLEYQNLLHDGEEINLQEFLNSKRNCVDL